MKDLAAGLYISPSEISESLHRSSLSGLIDYNKKRVNRKQLMEFLQHGLSYVFPQQPGAIVNGIPTAHSHPVMHAIFESEQMYVWSDVNGKERGQMIEPFYPRQIDAAKADEMLYELLALTDVIRVGRKREVHVAIEKLATKILS